LAAKDGRHDLDLRVPEFAGSGLPDRRPSFFPGRGRYHGSVRRGGGFRPQRGGLIARIFALRRTTPTIFRSAGSPRWTTPTIFRAVGSPRWEMTGMLDHLTTYRLRPERVTVIPTNSGLFFGRRPVLGSRPRWSRLREQRRALKHARAPSRPGTNGGALAESLGPASRTSASAFQSARPVLSMRTLSRPIPTVPWPFHRTTRRTSTCERGRSDFAPDCVRNNRGFTIAVCLSPRDRCIPLRNNRGFTIAEQPWIYHYGALSRSYCHTADRVAGRCIPLARRHAARIWGGRASN